MTDSALQLFERFATTLAQVSGLNGVADRLCEASRRLLDVDGAAITVHTGGDRRLTVAATNEMAVQLEDLQDVMASGPSLDAVRDGAVVITRLDTADGSWGLVRERAEQLGFAGTVISSPLRSESRVIGALTAHTHRTPADDVTSAATFLGVTVGAALVQDPQLAGHEEIRSTVWPSRAVIHQATGVVVIQAGVHPDDALALLRGRAFAESSTLLDVAEQVVARTITFGSRTRDED